MNKTKKVLAVLASVTAVAMAAIPVYAEESAEPTTEIQSVTEPGVDVEGTDTTQPASETNTEETSAEKTIKTIIAEPPADYAEKNEGSIAKWNGSGDVTVTASYPAETFGDTGEFISLTYKGSVVDSGNYTYSKNDDGSMSFTFKESYLKTLGTGSSFFSASFENCNIEHIVIINIDEPVSEAQADTVSAPKVGAPKTGSNGIGAASAVLLLSGVTAYILRKKK